MKLEQRNSELEKKLSSNVVNPNTSSKENSFNESFNLTADDSFSQKNVKMILFIHFN